MNIIQRCNYNVGDVIDQCYLVTKLLGEGTFGIVYLVVDKTDGLQKALKILKLWAVQSEEREILMKRFDREYETGRIKSDYLVHTFGKGIVKGNPYIVMEYCPGGDLQKAAKKGSIDYCKVALDILCGLRDLHKEGKVHRDLKPENVLFNANGRALLTDFGIAGDRNNRLTRTGIIGIPKQIFGTFAYMPPEQSSPRRGNATVLDTTDIFSFGVMMYEVLIGHLPFGPLESEKDLPTYVLNAKNGDWDRSALKKLPYGNEWLKLIEGCLVPDYKKRIPKAVDAIGYVPNIIKPKSFSQGWGTNQKTRILLRIMQGEEYGKVYFLNDLIGNKTFGIITIGHKSNDWQNTITIREEETHYISRKHCTLEWNGERKMWLLRDGQWAPEATNTRWVRSLNGTFLNSTEVNETGTTIKPGDFIILADVRMRVEGY